MTEEPFGELFQDFKNSIFLYLDEQEEEGDFHCRELDITMRIASSPMQDTKMLDLDEMIELSKGNTNIKEYLFAKFGRTDLRAKPGLPKGPYYYVDEKVYDAIHSAARGVER